jgi:hypothetical protein
LLWSKVHSGIILCSKKFSRRCGEIGCFSVGFELLIRLDAWSEQAFEVFVNKEIGNCSTAELLSTFCDNIMKTGGDKIEGEIDTLLDKIVMLFSYLSDKVSLLLMLLVRWLLFVKAKFLVVVVKLVLLRAQSRAFASV